jgi:iron uptake system component EfeO
VRPARMPGVIAIAAALAAVAACTEESSGDTSSGGAIDVTATDTTCEVSANEFPAGVVELAVTNEGSQVTEVYIYAPGDRIVTERENIGPGTSATVTAEVEAGSYQIACKPGMTGDGIRQDVTATGGGAATELDPALADAVAEYRTYVQTQADETLPKVRAFRDAIEAGDIDAAMAAYADSRIGWERTEPVAESFGDIDPLVDLREDGLTEGQEWTGWHRLERSLWETGEITDEDRALADQLVTDLEDWQQRVGSAEITPTSMANGAKELLDEVATGKVTGEEERYSHTDLVDFMANVEGAERAYELLEPVASENDPELTRQLDEAFTELYGLLGEYRQSDDPYDFVSYDTVGEPERRELSDGVNALAEPLSHLAAAVV